MRETTLEEDCKLWPANKSDRSLAEPQLPCLALVPLACVNLDVNDLQTCLAAP